MSLRATRFRNTMKTFSALRQAQIKLLWTNPGREYRVIYDLSGAGCKRCNSYVFMLLNVKEVSAATNVSLQRRSLVNSKPIILDVLGKGSLNIFDLFYTGLGEKRVCNQRIWEFFQDGSDHVTLSYTSPTFKTHINMSTHGFIAS